MILPRRTRLKSKDVPEDFIESCADILSDRFCVRLETSDLKKILLRDRYTLKSEIRCDSPSDTNCREWLIGMVAEDVGSLDWPNGTDSEEYSDEFMMDFVPKMVAKYGEDSVDSETMARCLSS